jgi:hypothetical protein
MIPQPFVKGSSERVFFGPYEYPQGADLIFDFGNPTCTSEFNSNRRVYNVGSANVTASLEPFYNPGAFYPVLSAANGGIASFRALQVVGYNYMQWDWKSTAEQTTVIVYAPSGSQDSGQSQYFPQVTGSANRANSIEPQIVYFPNRLYINMYNSSNNFYDGIFGTTNFETGSLNGRNGWNCIAATADTSSVHNFYLNMTTSSLNTTPITRVTSGTQTSRFPTNARANIMAFMQYPKVLTPKEIRQINRVFAQRYFT